MTKKSTKIISSIILYGCTFIYFGILAFIIYFISSVATNRYTTEAHFTITKDQKAQAASAMDLLGLGASLGTGDTQLAVGYIESVDLLQDIEEQFNTIEHYSNEKYDSWFRLDKEATLEERLEYYQEKITTKLDETTGMVKIKVDSYDPEYSREICSYILDKSETYINNLNKNVASERFKLVEDERDSAAKELTNAKKAFKIAQSKFELVSPENSISAKYDLLNKLQVTITSLKAALANIQYEDVRKFKLAEIAEIEKEHNKIYAELTGNEKDKFNKQINELKDKEYQLTRAQEIFDNTLIMFNQTRIDSIAKSRFFSRVQEPYLPEQPLEPRRLYLSCAIALLGLLLFSILRIFVKSILLH